MSSRTIPRALSWCFRLRAIKHRDVANLGEAVQRHTLYRGQLRFSSHSPLGQPAPTRKKVTLSTLRAMYQRGEPITMVTAHDFPSGHCAEHAGIDMILVGDSLAMVSLGMEDTSEVTLDDMLLHCKSVARGARSTFLVGDMPMGSYEVGPAQALLTAIRLVKEGRVNAVKLEGGHEMVQQITSITRAGIPVLAHIGLTPQRQNSLGGFRVQGKTKDSASQLLDDAQAVARAGAFGVVLEAIPAGVAEIVTKALPIPTIGIGAGAGCSGQVLVQNDMLGNFPPGRFVPKFVKQYGNVWSEALSGIMAYKADVKRGSFPADEHTYPMPKEDLDEFARMAEERAPSSARPNTPSE